MEKITLPNGDTKNILVHHFPALDGWEIQAKFRDYVRSDDKDFKRAFTIEVLSYAEVVLEETNLPLKTVSFIENHLMTWQNVQQIFEAVLKYNGIDPKSHAEKANYWDEAGARLAIGFTAEMTKLIGPAFEFATASANQKPESTTDK